MMEHPDIACALRCGYPAFQEAANRDTPESRDGYISANTSAFVAWLRVEHPDVLEEFVDDHASSVVWWLKPTGQDILDEFIDSCGQDYQAWLN